MNFRPCVLWRFASRAGLALLVTAALLALFLVTTSASSPTRELALPANPSDFVPDRVLVKFREGVSPVMPGKPSTGQTQLDRALAENGVERATPLFPTATQPGDRQSGLALDSVGLSRIYRLQLRAGQSVSQTMAALSGNPDVEYVEPDYIARPAAYPDDPRYVDQWGLSKIQVEGAWDVVTGTPAVAIAIVDAGVDLTHPDLAPNLWVNPGEIPGNGIVDDANGPQASDSTVAIEGWLNIIWGDPQSPGQPDQLLYTLTTADGQDIPLALAEPLPQSFGSLLALRGQFVTVDGGWVDKNQPALGFTAKGLRPAKGVLAPASAAVVGSQPWVSILCKFSDIAAEPKTPAYFQDMYRSSYPGMDHYWREQSFNLMNVSGSGATTQWYVLPQPRSYYVYDRNGDGEADFDWNRATADCTHVADPAVNFGSYVGINMMFNADLDCCAWGGSSYLSLDGVSKIWYTTWEPPWGYQDITVIAHEMGHGFGLPHSSGAYGATYDNQWDVMSDAWSNCNNSRDTTYGCLGQGTISYHKNLEGWIGSKRYVVQTSSQVTLTLEQLALPTTGNYLMAQVPINGSSSVFYTAEVRRKVGYDVKLPGEAVIIHQVDTSRIRPANVVDIDGNGNTGDAGAMWTVGETFSDAANDLSISVVGQTATGYAVSIAFTAAPEPFTPADDSTLAPGLVSFTWSPVTGATSYTIEIDSVPSFDSPGLVREALSESRYDHSFSATGLRYWRVRSSRGGNWGSVRRFTVAQPTVQVTADPYTNGDPAAVVLADGKLLVAWASDRNGTYGIWSKTSPDGGATWSEERLLDDTGFHDSDPVLAKADDGMLWLVWQCSRGNGYEICYRTSTDQGVTWSAARQLTTDTRWDPQPSIAQATDGKLWVVWTRGGSGSPDIWGKYTTDGGSSWSSDLPLVADPESDSNPAIVRAGDGRLSLVWVRFNSESLWYRTSIDNGLTWGSESPLISAYGDSEPSLAGLSNGTLWLAWTHVDDVWYRTSEDQGATWSAARRLTRSVAPDGSPSVTGIASDTAAIVWTSQRTGNPQIWLAIPGVREDVFYLPPYIESVSHLPAQNPDSDDMITFRASARDETGLAKVELVWTVNAIAQPDLPMYDDGAHGDDAAGDGIYGVQQGPFPQDAQVDYQARATDIDGNTYLSQRASFRVLPPFIKNSDILFVPDANGEDTAYFRPYFMNALSAVGYQYDVWDTGLRGAPDAMDLALYLGGVVVWAAPLEGYYRSQSVQQSIQTYLGAGGRLFITGQEVGYYSGWTGFYRDYLHAAFVQDNVGLTGVKGVTGDPIGNGLSLAIAGGDGANNQWWPDEIDPRAFATAVFQYDPASALAADQGKAQPVLSDMTNEDPEAIAGDANVLRFVHSQEQDGKLDGPAGPVGIISSGTAGLRAETCTYKVVYFAFGFEGINSQANRNAVMQRVIEWLKAPHADVKCAYLPTVLR